MKKAFGTVAVAAGMMGLVACSQTPQQDQEDVSEPTPTESTPEPTGTYSEPQGAEEEDPGVATDSDSAPARQDVPIESFGATNTYVHPFQVYVNEAYVDEDGYISDGSDLFYDQAPPGLEYHIFNIQITNNGTAPAAFDTYGTRGYDANGVQYSNDEGAEFTVADDYLGGELNPGVSVETDIIFLLPEDVQLVEVQVQGYGSLIPME